MERGFFTLHRCEMDPPFGQLGISLMDLPRLPEPSSAQRTNHLWRHWWELALIPFLPFPHTSAVLLGEECQFICNGSCLMWLFPWRSSYLCFQNICSVTPVIYSWAIALGKVPRFGFKQQWIRKVPKQVTSTLSCLCCLHFFSIWCLSLNLLLD